MEIRIKISNIIKYLTILSYILLAISLGIPFIGYFICMVNNFTCPISLIPFYITAIIVLVFSVLLRILALLIEHYAKTTNPKIIVDYGTTNQI